MKRNASLITVLFVGVGAWSNVDAQPSSATCASSGGRTLCVRFDNSAGAPQLNTDFSVAFDGSNNPSVTLLIGSNGGTTYQWRVWSEDSQQNPASITQISATANYNFDVKVLDDDGTAGATSIGTINLDPSGSDKYSRLSAGQITGDLTDDLLLQKASGGSGGDIDDFVIEGSVSSGSVITIPVITDLRIGFRRLNMCMAQSTIRAV